MKAMASFFSNSVPNRGSTPIGSPRRRPISCTGSRRRSAMTLTNGASSTLALPSRDSANTGWRATRPFNLKDIPTNVSFVCASSIQSIRFPSAMSKSFLKIRNPNLSDLPFPAFLHRIVPLIRRKAGGSPIWGRATFPLVKLISPRHNPSFTGLYELVRAKTTKIGVTGAPVKFIAIDRAKNSGNLCVLSFRESLRGFGGSKIVNANDQPLANTHMELSGLPRGLTFPVEPGHSYRLLYGNQKASPTQYDFARVFGGSKRKVLLSAQLGAEEITASYADPRPFTERRPNLLWIALGLAIILLGYAALRAMRTPDSAAQ